MRKNQMPGCIRLLLLCVIAIWGTALSVSAMTIDIPVIYHQTICRYMRDLINEARLENGIQNKVYTCYDLEKAAMQRAVEIAVYYEHSRPNGTGRETLVPEFSLSGKPAENIYCVGTGLSSTQHYFTEETAEGALSVFMNSPLHRSTILDPDLRAVGIGCAEIGGIVAWAQLFYYSRTPTGGNYVAPLDGAKTVSVEISDDLIESRNWFHLLTNTDYESVPVGWNKELDSRVYEIYGDANIARPVSVSWKMEDPSIAGFENGKLYGYNHGETILTGTAASGKSVSIRIYVPKTTLHKDNVTITLPADEYTETGNEICPVPVVTCYGNTLQNGKDYTLSYRNNKKPGTAFVDITGKGNYDDSVSTSFTIKARAAAVSTQSGTGQSTSGSSSSTSASSGQSASGQSGNGNAQTSTPVQKCATPVIRSVTNKASTIKITWKKVNGASAYKVSYYKSGGNTLKVISKKTRNLSFEMKKPVNGKTYFFSVSCLNENGKVVSKSSKSVSIVFLSKPVLRSVTRKSSTTALVRWWKEKGVSGYQIRYKIPGKKYRYLNVKKASTVKVNLKKLSKGKSCTVSIRSYKKANGKVNWSAWSKAKIINVK